MTDTNQQTVHLSCFSCQHSDTGDTDPKSLRQEATLSQELQGLWDPYPYQKKGCPGRAHVDRCPTPSRPPIHQLDTAELVFKLIIRLIVITSSPRCSARCPCFRPLRPRTRKYQEENLLSCFDLIHQGGSAGGSADAAVCPPLVFSLFVVRHSLIAGWTVSGSSGRCCCCADSGCWLWLIYLVRFWPVCGVCACRSCWWYLRGR